MGSVVGVVVSSLASKVHCGFRFRFRSGWIVFHDAQLDSGSTKP